MRDEYKKILVAVDGSEQSKEAVHEAVAIAQRNDASLTVLHVKDETRLTGTPIGLTMTIDTLEEDARRILEEVSKTIDGKIEFEAQSFLGNPKKEIVELAKELGTDLIVVGSNSKNLLDRILVGSTTTYVVSHAPCNIMVVK